MACVCLACAVVAVSAVAGDDFEISPTDGGRSELLPMGKVGFKATLPLTEGSISVTPSVPGETTRERETLSFDPHEPLRPGAVYAFHIKAESGDGRRVDRRFSLRVKPLDDTLWVYVKLDTPKNQVLVFRGDDLVRSMPASGGRPGDETPKGVFRIQNRGYHFWSQKYGEGAYYWVRIFGNYLFHSLPVDIEGNVIEEEAKKLGCPASHGCIRLSFPDAKWFYTEVPDGALVVIDRT